ncbi:hypothetical protein HJC23_012715 [Cyclotella cryptica]|uniref:Glycosyltransferase 61 catalytic domain-containing protein n=1 Tax=Cyclotella cryptica TaxID=29204 RepID=A0ABD3PLG5_9STRA|eukprot:CCRYP_013362-RA/>CCRYP_013362-RA protein AED:0.00 eAED:0.00 QI:341/-1/1/1/-1/1/1/880/678
MHRNNSRNQLTTIDGAISSIDTTTATVINNTPGLPPLLLRRTNSSTPPNPDEASPVNPTPNIPIADEDPGDRALNVSSHKRKTSGIPLEAEAIVRQNSKIFADTLGQIDDGDEEEGGSFAALQMMEFDDISDDSWWNHAVRTIRSSSLRSVLTTRKSLSLLVVSALFVTYLFSSGRDVGEKALPVSATPVSPVHTPPKDNSQSSITYGEEHMEVVGTPKEAHVHEFNKILFYDSPSVMKELHSKGPVLLNEKIGGLHIFENVCLTNNVDRRGTQDLRGLIYFDDKITGDQRCVPCKDASSSNDKAVNHYCGMTGLHTMYASSVNDWTECIAKQENLDLMKQFHQTQSPLNVNSIHFFKEPTFLLQFNALDMETSLFDMLMTYLPHWDQFRDEWDFPYDAVISHSLQGCLSHNHSWFCEILHQMNAFGPAKEIPWEPDDTTLYCFEELVYNEVGYQRNLDQGGLVTREILGEFREILFRKFALPRRRTVEDRKEEEESLAEIAAAAKRDGTNIPDNIPSVDSSTNKPKIIFYDNKLSQQTKWNEMETLISKARSLEKYQGIKFVTVDDFSTLTVAQQARTFNEADAVIMVRGEHMANVIFAVDGTTFVEVGCEVKSLIGNPRFMELMDGTYKSVEKCKEGGKDDVACVVCDGDSDTADFTMSPAAFEKMIDDVVRSLSS